MALPRSGYHLEFCIPCCEPCFREQQTYASDRCLLTTPRKYYSFCRVCHPSEPEKALERKFYRQLRLRDTDSMVCAWCSCALQIDKIWLCGKCRGWCNCGRDYQLMGLNTIEVFFTRK